MESSVSLCLVMEDSQPLRKDSYMGLVFLFMMSSGLSLTVHCHCAMNMEKLPFL